MKLLTAGLRRLRGLLKEARLMAYRFREWVTGYRRERRKFREELGYELDLESPRSFNEKTVWKKLHDRNPLIPITSDKHRVRSYVREVLGDDRAEEILIPQLYVTERPETIPFERLPDSYVVKANHASGWNIFVRDNDTPEDEIVARCRDWLHQPFGDLEHEWAYREIDRKIVVEKLLLTEDGKRPWPFRIRIFHGECRLISAITERFSDKPHALCFMDSEFNPLPVNRPEATQPRDAREPENGGEMIQLAKQLAEPFDAVRVDLFSIQGRIYFNELTHYSKTGRGRFEPRSFDFELGEHWTLEPEYWKHGEQGNRVQQLLRSLSSREP